MTLKINHEVWRHLAIYYLAPSKIGQLKKTLSQAALKYFHIDLSSFLLISSDGVLIS